MLAASWRGLAIYSYNYKLYPSEAILQRNLQVDKCGITLWSGWYLDITREKRAIKMKAIHYQCINSVNNTKEKFKNTCLYLLLSLCKAASCLLYKESSNKWTQAMEALIVVHNHKLLLVIPTTKEALIGIVLWDISKL